MSTIRLREVTLSYPALFEPKAGMNGEGKPKYSAVFIIEKDNESLKELAQAIKDCAAEKWGDEVPPSVLPLKTYCCLRDGDDKKGTEFHGKLTLNASNSRRPAVVDNDPKVPITAEQDRVYGGCVVNALVSFWAMDNSYGQRVCCNLEAVQFVRDGDRFGAAPVDPEAGFDVVPGGSTASFSDTSEPDFL